MARRRSREAEPTWGQRIAAAKQSAQPPAPHDRTLTGTSGTSILLSCNLPRIGTSLGAGSASGSTQLSRRLR